MENCNIYKTPEQPVSHVSVHNDLLLIQEKYRTNELPFLKQGKVKSENSKVTEYSKWMAICKGKEY